MIELRKSLFSWIADKRGMARWRRAVRDADAMAQADLNEARKEARKLRFYLTEFIAKADGRLMEPVAGSNSLHLPHGVDWSWRPAPWRVLLETAGLSAIDNKSQLGDDVALFHDCARCELIVRQRRNRGGVGLAPFCVNIEAFKFDGSFMSMALDLPEAAVEGLQARHLIRMDLMVEMERPLEIFARLNVRHGPNTEQIVREIGMYQSDVSVEFDLAYSGLGERKVERAWIDLIFKEPGMNQMIVHDLTFCRLPRAEL